MLLVSVDASATYATLVYLVALDELRSRVLSFCIWLGLMARLLGTRIATTLSGSTAWWRSFW